MVNKNCKLQISDVPLPPKKHASSMLSLPRNLASVGGGGEGVPKRLKDEIMFRGTLGDVPPPLEKLKVAFKIRATLGLGDVLRFDYDSSGFKLIQMDDYPADNCAISSTALFVRLSCIELRILLDETLHQDMLSQKD